MKMSVKFGSVTLRCLVVAMMVVLGGVSGLAALGSASSGAYAAVVSSISVRGNQRVDSDTIRSYVTVKPGRSYSSFDTDESLSQLFATGLFADVQIRRSGNTLVVEVVENPTVNLVIFEGNDKVKDERLQAVTQLQSLSIFSQDKLDSDVERVRETVRRSGRSSATVFSRIDQLDNNRVNVVFVINEGGRTKIADIDFIGNNAYGDRRLMEVISHNESNFLSWLKRDDIFDPDRLKADEERLRQFYYNRGYADFRVISSSAELNEAENKYTISITVEEGERYRFGQITIDNALAVVSDETLRGELTIDSGDIYSARNVEKTLISLTEYIAETGYSFAEVTPRGERNFDTRTIDLTFFVDEGPRVYVERIEIVGNTRTRGYVIRREFDISEGDAYNRVYVNRAKRRLDGLGFFESVRVTSRPGSAPDRVVLLVDVRDKATGELAVGGGYSSTNGPIAELSLTERNFLGRGQYIKLSGGYGSDTVKYELSFTQPYFLGNRIAAGFDLSHEELDSSDGTRYSNTVSLMRLRAAVNLSDNLRLQGNYTLKREELDADDGATLSAATQDSVDRSPYITSSLGYSLVYDTLDNPRNPREGYKFTLRQDFAGVGGDAQYIRTQGRAAAYYLVHEDADIVALGSVGAGNVYGWGDDLRVLDHFFQGGETIRGFESRGFGPRDSVTGEPLGGTTYVNATAEVQFPMPFLPRSYGLRGAFFADAGTLFGNDFDGATVDDENELRASVGGSVIWDSPFGPLRADFSHVLSKADGDKTEVFRFGASTRF